MSKKKNQSEVKVTLFNQFVNEVSILFITFPNKRKVK